jgi:SAM-dependent methyltransferase
MAGIENSTESLPIPAVLEAYRSVALVERELFWASVSPEEEQALTIATYNRTPALLAEHMSSMPSRVSEIDEALTLSGHNPYSPVTPTAKVIEIGCGAGRDARDIAVRSGSYLGIDPSEGLIDLARQANPGLDFVVADALSADFPENLDTAFAFASLLHVDKNTLAEVFDKTAGSLKTGGVIYATLKQKEKYEKVHYTDNFQGEVGSRTFFGYDATTVLDAAGRNLRTEVLRARAINDIPWLTVILRKT